MKCLKKLSFLYLLFWLSLAGAAGCGNGDGPVDFTISPSTATVQRNATLQFDTNPSDLSGVEWSVVGGEANGTIDEDGLYTAPEAIPVDNVVTLSAERDGITDTATVTLIAADTLSFSSSLQINDTPVPVTTAGFAIIYQGAGNGIGVGLGSVEVSSTWVADFGNVTVMYAQSTNFAPFLPEINVTNNDGSLPTSLILDQNLNPGIFYTSTVGALNFIGSSDHGASFSAPVPIVNPPTGLAEAMGTSVVDDDNNYYLSYTDDFVGARTIKFAKSEDQGTTWSSPVSVTPSLNPALASNIAVTADGTDVAVCYTEDVSGESQIFLSLSTDGGSTFPVQTNVSQSVGASNLFCGVAFGPQGQIYIVYQQTTTTADVLFVSSVDGGVSFTAPVMVNSVTDGEQTLPYLSVDASGRITVVWGDDNNVGAQSIQLNYGRSTDGGATFSNGVIVPASAATFVLPKGLVSDPLGRLHLQYLSDVNDPGNNVDFFYIYGQ